MTIDEIQELIVKNPYEVFSARVVQDLIALAIKREFREGKYRIHENSMGLWLSDEQGFSVNLSEHDLDRLFKENFSTSSTDDDNVSQKTENVDTTVFSVGNKGDSVLFKNRNDAIKYLQEYGTSSNGLELIIVPVISSGKNVENGDKKVDKTWELAAKRVSECMKHYDGKWGDPNGCLMGLAAEFSANACGDGPDRK